MSLRVGLTGSIGMGKSTTAQMFVDEGCAVWDADAAVHRLYSKGGAAVEPMRAAFPDAIVDDAVDRGKLKAILGANPDTFKTLEQIVHPLVGQDRQAFIDTATADILIFDIPLLFETGGNANMDAVVCVSAPADVQRERVLARGTMTEAQFEQILTKQMPDAEKRMLADFVVETDTLEHAREQVQDIVKTLRNRL
ncbi:MAG: dephospho-CoA kinase [Paracoccaceae bacterium]